MSSRELPNFKADILEAVGDEPIEAVIINDNYSYDGYFDDISSRPAWEHLVEIGRASCRERV